MLYYKTSFSKKAVFLLKTGKNQFAGGHDCFEGRVCLATKVNITFFVGIEILNIFHLTIFSKNPKFSKIAAKNYLFEEA